MTSLFFLGPRAAILVWWLLQPLRWQAAFDTYIWPVLGFLLLPWTTLAYVVVAPGGVFGAEWLLIVLAFLVDLASYAGGGYGNRDRVAGYAR
ncbi:MAG TPA: hypothetical protein VIC57_05620 [Candidatus Dormibacteraeota bacterium]